MEFVSFHTHSTYSYADGFGTVKQHVKRVSELGMRALALSEHGNVNSHAALERECNQAGIKPIFGIEAYFGGVTEEKRSKSKFHVTLFAMDDEGYRNLNRIVTQSYIDSYQYPTVSPESLMKYAKGIAVFSGCSDSLISCTLLGGKSFGEKRDKESSESLERARGKIQWFQDVFGDRFYLEVQRFPGLDRTCILNSAFAKLGAECGVPLIATADVHYPRPEHNKMQSLLHSARRKSTIAVTEANWEYNVLLTYPLSDEEIINDLVGTGLTENQAYGAVINTNLLAAQCNVELPKAKALKFKTENGRSAADELKARIRDGWRHRVSQRPDLATRKASYSVRVSHELKVIVDKDFCDYFLVTADLTKWAKDNDITVGPGRGSAAGSLVCYLLGITEIDPLHPTFQRMVFERFIDPTRNDMPDIDLDFDDARRNEVAERAREVYGKENVANVSNHIKYRGKSALQDVARSYAISLKVFDPIGKRITDRIETDDRVDDSIIDVIQSYRDDPEVIDVLVKYKSHVLQAIALEGNQHSMGTHAGGFVISSEPIPDVCAIYNKRTGQGRSAKNIQVIPYEKRDAEHLGLLKMDFLGLSAMGQVGLCRKWTGMSLDELYVLFYSNQVYRENGWVDKSPEVLELFRSDDVTGIFQYEGGTTRQVTRDVSPNNFDELAACNALSRPGPLYGGQTSEYIKVKHGEKDWERIHPTGFDRHVEWTYGQIIYQEQIMWILRDLAGFSTERVLKVRKIIGKKLGEFQFAELWAEFERGCASNGVSSDDAGKVWSGITTAAGYAFNTSHAYSYALVAWWQAWFKIHKPEEFFAATLTKNGDGKNQLARRTALLQDAEKHEIEILPFDVSVMTESWRVGSEFLYRYRNAIMPGFEQIPAIGEKNAADLMARIRQYENMGRSAKDWGDLATIKGIGQATIVKMVDFCSQDDPLGIHKTEVQLDVMRKQIADGEFNEQGLPDSTEFVSGRIPDENGWVAWVGLVANIVLRDEVETIRARTGKNIDDIKAEMDAPEKTKKATIFAYDENGEIALRVSRWVYDDLSEVIAKIQPDHHIVVAWGRTFEGRPNSIQLRSLWLFNPD